MAFQKVFFFNKIRFNIIHVMSVLHRAIEREKYEIVEILLSHPNIDVDAKMTDINNGIQKKFLIKFEYLFMKNQFWNSLLKIAILKLLNFCYRIQR